MKNSLMEIKRSLDPYVGSKIVLKANGGRRKTIQRTGILEETYPSVFIVKLDQDQHAFKPVFSTAMRTSLPKQSK